MKVAIIIISAMVAMCILPAMGEFTAEDWSNQANQYFINGSFEEAAASNDKALELDPEPLEREVEAAFQAVGQPRPQLGLARRAAQALAEHERATAGPPDHGGTPHA